MVSFDGGTKETYEAHRVGLSFNGTLHSVRHFMQTRNMMRLIEPTVNPLMVITKENEDTVDAFTHLWDGLLSPHDRIIFGYPMNWAGEVEIAHPVRPFGYTTPSVYLNSLLFILHTGESVMCCMDYEGREIVGDANIQTPQEIFNGFQLQKLRKLYAEKRWDQLPMCSKCSFKT